MTKTASFDKTHMPEIITANPDAELIMRLVFLYLVATKFVENKSHLVKNKLLKMNPPAHKTRIIISLTVIVISP